MDRQRVASRRDSQAGAKNVLPSPDGLALGQSASAVAPKAEIDPTASRNDTKEHAASVPTTPLYWRNVPLLQGCECSPS